MRRRSEIRNIKHRKMMEKCGRIDHTDEIRRFHSKPAGWILSEIEIFRQLSAHPRRFTATLRDTEMHTKPAMQRARNEKKDLS